MEDGIRLTSHAWERCQERGITFEDVLRVASKGREEPCGEGRRILEYKKVAIVVNDLGEVVTAWRKESGKRREKERRKNAARLSRIRKHERKR